MSNKNQHNSINYYISYFFVYSFIGWTMETIYSYFRQGYFVNRGFLYGPLCPIYGFGVTILLALLHKYKDNILLFFLTSSLLLTTLEFLTGAALYLAFHARWWDYSSMDLNLYGYICFGAAVLWGLLSVIFMHSFHPFIERFVCKFLNKAAKAVIYFLLLLTVLDFVLSIFSAI